MYRTTFKEAPAGSWFKYDGEETSYLKVNSQDNVAVDGLTGKFLIDTFEGDEEIWVKRGGYSLLNPDAASRKMRFCDMPDGAFFVFCFKYTNERRLFMKVDDWFAVDILTGDYQFDFSCETFVKRFP
jgi:hypothetical protein